MDQNVRIERLRAMLEVIGPYASSAHERYEYIKNLLEVDRIGCETYVQLAHVLCGVHDQLSYQDQVTLPFDVNPKASPLRHGLCERREGRVC